MNSDRQTSDERPMTSFGMLIARLTWAILGPAALFISTYKIAEGGRGWTSVLDLFFFIFLTLTTAARWFDYWYGDGRTLMGDLATPKYMRSYTAVLCGVALTAWIVANVIGNYLLR